MINRRKFLKTTTASAMLSCFPATLSGISRQKVAGHVEKRSLGKTGDQLSMIGFGGIVVTNSTTKEASDRVAQAVDYGINYFDVAPTYGNAEEMLGPALKPYRKDAFLACKTQARDKDGALKELENSLRLLETDFFDLYQMHAVTRVSDVEKILGPGGALEAFLEARKAGKIRHIGFSAHSVEAATKLIQGYHFDTILFPFNYGTWNAGNFGPQVMDMAKEKQMGILALKAMAKRPRAEGEERAFEKCWYVPLSERNEAEMGLRFTLSHPVTAAIPPGDEKLFSMALELATEFRPLDGDEVEEMKKRALAEEPLFRYPSENA